MKTLKKNFDGTQPKMGLAELDLVSKHARRVIYNRLGRVHIVFDSTASVHEAEFTSLNTCCTRRAEEHQLIASSLPARCQLVALYAEQEFVGLHRVCLPETDELLFDIQHDDLSFYSTMR